MSRRFEIARAIGTGNAGLFDAEDGAPQPRPDFRSCRTVCTSRRSSRSWRPTRAARSTRPARSRNGTRSCCPRRTSTMSKHRHDVAELLQHCRRGARRPALSRRGCLPRRAGPRFLLVFLRGGYDADQLLIPYSQQLLLRGAPEHRHRRDPMPHPSAGALALDADWALAPALRDSIGAAVSAAAGRLRALCRHRGSVAQPLRDPGQHRARPAAAAARAISARVSWRAFPTTLHGSVRARRRADRLHRRAAAVLPGRRRTIAEHLAEERRQTAFR